MAKGPEFSAYTDASTVAAAFPLSIQHKVFLITGVGNGGIGGTTAKALAPHSPRLLILAGRSADKVNAVISDIATSHPTVSCRFLAIDLSSQASIREAAAEVLAYPEPLHVLINNAAVMLMERALTPGGIEMQFQTNHLGPFLFTNLLLPKLLSTASSSPSNTVRIVNLSSAAHALSPVRFSDLDFSKPNDSVPEDEQFATQILSNLGLLVYDGHYVSWAAYGHSKTASILFTIALNARLGKAKIAGSDNGIESFAVHPGSINTDLQRHASMEVIEEARKKGKDMNVVQKTLEQGASTTLVAALDPALRVAEGGVGYMSDCSIVEPSEWCKDKRGRETAQKLWNISEEMVGEKFEW